MFQTVQDGSPYIFVFPLEIDYRYQLSPSQLDFIGLERYRDQVFEGLVVEGDYPDERKAGFFDGEYALVFKRPLMPAQNVLFHELIHMIEQFLYLQEGYLGPVNTEVEAELGPAIFAMPSKAYMQELMQQMQSDNPLSMYAQAQRGIFNGFMMWLHEQGRIDTRLTYPVYQIDRSIGDQMMDIINTLTDQEINEIAAALFKDGEKYLNSALEGESPFTSLGADEDIEGVKGRQPPGKDGFAPPRQPIQVKRQVDSSGRSLFTKHLTEVKNFATEQWEALRKTWYTEEFQRVLLQRLKDFSYEAMDYQLAMEMYIFNVRTLDLVEENINYQKRQWQDDKYYFDRGYYHIVDHYDPQEIDRFNEQLTYVEGLRAAHRLKIKQYGLKRNVPLRYVMDPQKENMVNDQTKALGDFSVYDATFRVGSREEIDDDFYVNEANQWVSLMIDEGSLDFLRRTIDTNRYNYSEYVSNENTQLISSKDFPGIGWSFRSGEPGDWEFQGPAAAFHEMYQTFEIRREEAVAAGDTTSWADPNNMEKRSFLRWSQITHVGDSENTLTDVRAHDIYVYSFIEEGKSVRDFVFGANDLESLLNGKVWRATQGPEIDPVADPEYGTINPADLDPVFQGFQTYQQGYTTIDVPADATQLDKMIYGNFTDHSYYPLTAGRNLRLLKEGKQIFDIKEGKTKWIYTLTDPNNTDLYYLHNLTGEEVVEVGSGIELLLTPDDRWLRVEGQFFAFNYNNLDVTRSDEISGQVTEGSLASSNPVNPELSNTGPIIRLFDQGAAHPDLWLAIGPHEANGAKGLRFFGSNTTVDLKKMANIYAVQLHGDQQDALDIERHLRQLGQASFRSVRFLTMPLADVPWLAIAVNQDGTKQFIGPVAQMRPELDQFNNTRFNVVYDLYHTPEEFLFRLRMDDGRMLNIGPYAEMLILEDGQSFGSGNYDHNLLPSEMPIKTVPLKAMEEDMLEFGQLWNNEGTINTYIDVKQRFDAMRGIEDQEAQRGLLRELLKVVGYSSAWPTAANSTPSDDTFLKHVRFMEKLVDTFGEKIKEVLPQLKSKERVRFGQALLLTAEEAGTGIEYLAELNGDGLISDTERRIIMSTAHPEHLDRQLRFSRGNGKWIGRFLDYDAVLYDVEVPAHNWNFYMYKLFRVGLSWGYVPNWTARDGWRFHRHYVKQNRLFNRLFEGIDFESNNITQIRDFTDEDENVMGYAIQNEIFWAFWMGLFLFIVLSTFPNDVHRKAEFDKTEQRMHTLLQRLIDAHESQNIQEIANKVMSLRRFFSDLLNYHSNDSWDGRAYYQKRYEPTVENINTLFNDETLSEQDRIVLTGLLALPADMPNHMRAELHKRLLLLVPNMALLMLFVPGMFNSDEQHQYVQLHNAIQALILEHTQQETVDEDAFYQALLDAMTDPQWNSEEVLQVNVDRIMKKATTAAVDVRDETKAKSAVKKLERTVTVRRDGQQFQETYYEDFHVVVDLRDQTSHAGVEYIENAIASAIALSEKYNIAFTVNVVIDENRVYAVGIKGNDDAETQIRKLFNQLPERHRLSLDELEDSFPVFYSPFQRERFWQVNRHLLDKVRTSKEGESVTLQHALVQTLAESVVVLADAGRPGDGLTPYFPEGTELLHFNLRGGFESHRVERTVFGKTATEVGYLQPKARDLAQVVSSPGGIKIDDTALEVIGAASGMDVLNLDPQMIQQAQQELRGMTVQILNITPAVGFVP